MEILLRLYLIINRILNFLLKPFLYLIFNGFNSKLNIPPIDNSLLLIAAVDLAEKIRNKEIKSEDVVRAYISRIKTVNIYINAVIDERFDDAIEEAQKADKMCLEMSTLYLIKNYPLLGVPFTVKGSIAVKGLSHIVGSVARMNTKATKNAVVVDKMRAAGAIPLCVSNTPEYCVSWECYNHVNGRTLNPYDSSRTCGGSSGGEGALLGCGASVFGIGSDIGGSIRIPSLCNGCFGHKPTEELISLDGHFPSSPNPKFQRYLTVGPMCRFAKDLPTLTYLLSEEKYVEKLKMDQPILTTDIKVYYMETMGSTIATSPVDKSIQDLILTAASHFKSNGVTVERPDLGDFTETIEMCSSAFFSLEDTPNILEDKANLNLNKDVPLELVKSMLGKSQYTFAALYFYGLQAAGGFMTKSQRDRYVPLLENLKTHLLKLLGTNGAMLYPTLNKPALMHYESVMNMGSIPYCSLFNLLGFPSTHIPCGKNEDGLPIGFQVVAAPFQDRLCFVIAREIEAAFGGFKFP